MAVGSDLLWAVFPSHTSNWNVRYWRKADIGQSRGNESGGDNAPHQAAFRSTLREVESDTLRLSFTCLVSAECCSRQFALYRELPRSRHKLSNDSRRP